MLWAFAESGLGGLLHGFRIPVTGFVLGAFAVVVISLIAYFSQRPWQETIRATLLVLAIKFAASPHSPVAAYLAVFFQGIVGAAIFQIAGFRRITVVIFSVLVLLESAVQKPLVATLVFGQELWIALDELVMKLAAQIGMMGTENFSRTFLIVYCLVYMVWGFYVGLWTSRLPARLAETKKKLADDAFLQDVRVPRTWHWTGVLPVIVACIALTLYLIGQPGPWYYLARTFLIIAGVYWLVRPFTKWLLRKLSRARQREVAEFTWQLPRLRRIAYASKILAAHEPNAVRKLTTFVHYLIYFTLTLDADENSNPERPGTER